MTGKEAGHIDHASPQSTPPHANTPNPENNSKAGFPNSPAKAKSAPPSKKLSTTAAT